MTKANQIKKENKETEVVLMNGKTYDELVKNDRQYRGDIKKYISEELVQNTDYGIIVFGGKPSKPCLFKPGAEKIINLLGLVAKFYKDEDALSMIPQENIILNGGAFCFRCELVSRKDGKVITEGRGICTIKEKGNNFNVAIKIAQKRAKIDAVLSLGLSDSYTQDIEDMTPHEVENIPATTKNTKENLKKSVMGLFNKINNPSKALTESMKKIDILDEKKLKAYSIRLSEMLLSQSKDKEKFKILEDIKGLIADKKNKVDADMVKNCAIALFGIGEAKNLTNDQLKEVFQELSGARGDD